MTNVSEHALSPERGRKWPTLLALLFIHIGACAAFLPTFFSWSALAAAVVLYYLTGSIGICLGYHRLLTHRSFCLPRFVEYGVTFIGMLALQGGPIEWVSTHRVHHKYSDSERDPHDSSRGFYFAHMGWLYDPNPARLDLAQRARFAADLHSDPFYRFLDKTHVLWQIALFVALYAIGGWSWLIWAGFVRLVFTYHATWLVNSASHLFGYRNFKPLGEDKSTNNWLVALFAWGEGWHNNHHVFPSSARHGMRWWEIDVTWFAIQLLSLIGVARGVLVPPPETQERRRILSPQSSPRIGT